MREGRLERGGGHAPDGNIVNNACGNQPDQPRPLQMMPPQSPGVISP
jgi:hypothetical protein